MNLDMTVLQSAGIKHDDQLRIEYDPGSADDGLKSAAVTLDGTSIRQRNDRQIRYDVQC